MSALLPAPSAMHAPPPFQGSDWGRALLRNAWIPLLLIALVFVGRKFEFANPYVVHIAMIAGIYVILAISLQLINGISGQFSLGHAGFMAVGAYLGGYSTPTFAPPGLDPHADHPHPPPPFRHPRRPPPRLAAFFRGHCAGYPLGLAGGLHLFHAGPPLRILPSAGAGSPPVGAARLDGF